MVAESLAQDEKTLKIVNAILSLRKEVKEVESKLSNIKKDMTSINNILLEK